MRVGGSGMRIALATVVLLSLLQTSVHAQMWADAEWLYFARLSGSNVPVISGPNGFSTDNDGSGSGYRLSIGGHIGDFEIDASFLNIEGLSSSSTGTLTNALSFDTEANNATVFNGGANGTAPANTLAISNALFRAATYAGAGDNETLEAEFLLPGATVALQSYTDVRSGEINFGTNRNLRPWRLGVGYRTWIVTDGTSSLISGTFDALDADDAQTVGGGTNDANDGLSHAALTSAGYGLVAGGADGFDAIAVGGPDTLRIFDSGYARNELHGAQLTGAYQLFPLEWLTLEVIGRAGLYYNNVQGSVLEQLAGSVNDDSIYQRAFSGKKSAASFVGTLGFRGLFPITDYISVIAGYEAIFMGGVALGSKQFEGISTTPLGAEYYDPRSSNHLILHGGNLGLQITW